MAAFFKKQAFLHTAGIIAVALAVSFNLGKVLELVSAKGKVAGTGAKTDITATSKAINSFAAVVEKNPFGIKGARFSVVRKESGVATDPKGLVLKGAITQKPGFAFIENKDGLQRLFKRGDDVFGAGKLTAVYPDKVSISGQGSVFDLKFPSIETLAGKTPGGAAASGQPRKGSPREMTFDREQIKKFLDNPNELLTGARLMPMFKDGKQEGFVVREVRAGGIYENMGLQNGDIILRANNVELNSPGDGVKIFNMIKELDRMELDIVRNGMPVTQVYHIN